MPKTKTSSQAGTGAPSDLNLPGRAVAVVTAASGTSAVAEEAVQATASSASALVPEAAVTTATARPGRFRSLGAPVPAWLLVFVFGIGLALGYCIAR